MSDARLPAIIYLFLLLFGVLHFAQVYPQLPEQVASHFAADGSPNGWSPKGFFFLLMGFAVVMSAIPAFPYDILWGERKVVSVANLTRADGLEFLKVAHQAKIHTTIQEYPLLDANAALDDLRHSRFSGAAVLIP